MGGGFKKLVLNAIVKNCIISNMSSPSVKESVLVETKLSF